MPFAARTELATVLAKLIKLSNSNTQYEFKVNSFLNILVWETDFEQAVLLALDRDKRHLSPLGRADSPFPRSSIDLEGGGILSRSIADRQAFLADPADIEQLPPDWRAFAEPYAKYTLLTPLCDDKTIYGVLMLLAQDHQELSRPQAILMEAAANELTIAIKNSQLATDTRKRLSVMNVLSDLGRTLSSTIDVEKVMTMIPQIATGIFLADGCTLNILDEEGRALVMSSQHGLIPPSSNFERYRSSKSLPAGVAAALVRRESFSGYLKDDPSALELSEAEMNNTVISAPLIFQGRRQGSISLFNKLGGRSAEPVSPQLFDRDDLELLFSMNNMISGVLENAITFKEVESLARSNEKMVAYLSTLYDISSAMMTTVRYDELAWIIIRALTDRRGLNFDQVLILLLDQDAERGPILRSSAFWTHEARSAGQGQAPGESLVELLKNPSGAEAALMLERGREMDLAISVFPESQRILSRVVTEKKPMLGFRIFDTESDIDLKDFGLKAYAAVPMIAKNREVGVIAVDRSISGEPLTTDSLRDLTMLANQAGLAIENARLYDDLEKANQTLTQVRVRLIEAEKVAAQGEMGAHLAHEVRNPLVSIGGFTQRLLKKMNDDDPLRKYARVIWEEVERVNRVLTNVLDFSRNEDGRVREFSMEALLNETLASLRHDMSRKKIAVVKDCRPDLPPVRADDRQIMHIIVNIISNASQAMGSGGGKIYVRLFEVNSDQLYVACEITDTGPGIPDDMLEKLFSPFFTTKSDGTGLGLSIVKKIIDRYHGFIGVKNRPDHIENSGASFTFMFPAAQGGSLRP